MSWINQELAYHWTSLSMRSSILYPISSELLWWQIFFFSLFFLTLLNSLPLQCHCWMHSTLWFLYIVLHLVVIGIRQGQKDRCKNTYLNFLNNFSLNLFCSSAACLAAEVYGRVLDNSFSLQTSPGMAGALAAPGQTTASTFYVHQSPQVSWKPLKAKSGGRPPAKSLVD